MTCRTVYFLPTGKPAKFGGIEIEYLPKTCVIYCTFIHASCAKVILFTENLYPLFKTKTIKVD